MSRILALLAALLLVLSCPPAMADETIPPYSGTSWLSEEGWLYTFSGNGMVFYADIMYPGYVAIAPGMYVPIRAIASDGYIINPDDTPYILLHDGDTLMLKQSTPDDVVTLTFSQVDNTAALSGTSWQNEHGEIFTFSGDANEFFSPVTGQFFQRSPEASGSYYALAIGPDGERYDDPDAPYSFRYEDNKLHVYTVNGRLMIYWQTFTPVAE